ncbi:MAG: hypothetical protein U9O87_09900, partial [Verrucomicrobiota bacterium]|nr:hypothetical protein [Verrucomicrobiota bacterium]
MRKITDKSYPKRILVLGLGVSGFAAAKLALSEKNIVTVLDEGISEKLEQRSEQIKSRGGKVFLSWNGREKPGEFD